MPQTNKPPFTLLTCDRWNGSQSKEMRAVYKLVTHGNVIRWHTLRVDIDRDSYDQQCSATVDRWDGDRWQHVASIPYPLMNTVRVARAYGDWTDADRAAFDHDATELLRRAEEVLR